MTTASDPSRRVPPTLAATLLAALLAALPACASSGYRQRFEPLPAVVQVHTSQGTLDLALVSVLGVIRPEETGRDEIHLRFRLQNGTKHALKLPVDRLRLLSGDLADFSPPLLIAGETVAEPGQDAVADVAFTFLDGERPDLRGLTLTWVLEVEGTELRGTVAFRRLAEVPRYHHGPTGWWPHGPPPGYPYWGFGWHGSSHPGH
jgi:hypothetical protein